MSGPPKRPHEVLGLPFGADRPAIDAAYRRLIKRHHPDRPGGDAASAKAVIQAYRALVRAPDPLPLVLLAPTSRSARRRAGAWVGLGAVTAIAGGLLWLAPWTRGAIGESGSPVIAAIDRTPPRTVRREGADPAAVDAGISEARRLDLGSVAGMLAYSRSCEIDLAKLPGYALLDHCLAFDLAAARGRYGRQYRWQPNPMTRRHDFAAARVMVDPILARARVGEVRMLVERRLMTPN